MPEAVDYDTPLDPPDLAIVNEWTAAHGEDSSDPAGMLDFALGRGATLHLVSRLAYMCVTREPHGNKRVTDLPYIQKMLGAGYEPAVVRDLFVRFCLIEGGQGEHYSHCEGFWCNDSIIRKLFDTADGLLAFLGALAEVDPNPILAHRDYLAYWLGARRNPEARGEEARMKVGAADARVVMMRAARSSNLGMVETDGQLKVLLDLPPAEVATAACWVRACWIRNLLLMGYALASHLTPQRNADVILMEIRDELRRRPERAPESYRWLLEGIRRAGGDQYWQFSRHHDTLRWAVESAGWQFMRVTSRDNPRRPGQPDLQVEPKGRTGRIVLKHRIVDFGDKLKEGDEVIVSERLIQDKAPVFTGTNLRIFVTELPAAAPPNWAMEQEFMDHNRFFPDRQG